MRLEQKRIITFGILSILYFAIGACSFKSSTPEGSDESTASFHIENVSILNHDTQNNLTETNIKTKSYSIKSCFIDPVTTKKILDQEFMVKSSSEASLKTNVDGCGTFEHAIEYNQIENERFIPFDVKFIGNKPYSGEMTLQFAINPWQNKIIDTRYTEISSQPGNLKESSESINSVSPDVNSPKLHISQTTIKPDQPQVTTDNNILLNFDLIASLSIQKISLDGNNDYDSAENLKVAVDTKFITISDSSVPKAITGMSKGVAGKIAKDKATFEESSLFLFEPINPNLSNRLYFKVYTTKSTAPIRAYYGYIELIGTNIFAKQSTYTPIEISKEEFENVDKIQPSIRDSGHQDFQLLSVNQVNLKTKENNVLDVSNRYLLSQTSNIELCITDNITNQRIQNHSFKIIENNTEHVTKTDERGCMNWVLVYDFYLLNQEGVFIVKPQVIGDHPYAKPTAFELAINPWNNTIYNLMQQNLPSRIKIIPTSRPSIFPNKSSQLNISRIELSPQEHSVVNNRKSIDFAFSLDGEFIRLNSESDSISEKLENIVGQVELYLISSSQINGKSEKVGEAKEQPVPLHTKNNKLITESLKLSLNRTLTADDFNHLYVKVTTQPGTSYAHVWFGKTLLNTDKILNQRLSLSPEVLDQAEFEAAINSANSNTDTKPMYIPVLKKNDNQATWFYPSQWQFNYSGWSDFSDPKSGKAASYYNFAVCLKDSATNQPIKNKSFYVASRKSLTDGIEIDSQYLTTDMNGCLASTKPFKINYNFWAGEEYTKLFLLITSNNQSYEKSVGAIEYYINPWQENSNRYHWDSTNGEPSFYKRGQKPTLSLSKIRHTFDPSFSQIVNINKYLELGWIEYFKLKFTPQLRRSLYGENSLSAHSKLELLGSGVQFDLQAAIITNDTSGKAEGRRVISQFRTRVSVDNDGEIEANIPMAYDFTERPYLEASAHLYIRLSLVSNGVVLEPTTVKVPFNYLRDFSVLDILEKDIKASEINTSNLIPDSYKNEPVELTEKFKEELGLTNTSFSFTKPRKIQTSNPYDLFEQKVRWAKGRSPNRVNLKFHNNPQLSNSRNRMFIEGEFKNNLEGDHDIDGDNVFKLAQSFCDVYDVYTSPEEKARAYLNLENIANAKNLLRNAWHWINKVNNNINFEECLENPFKYVQVRKFTFIDEVSSQPKSLGIDKTFLGFSASFSYMQGTYERESNGERRSFNVDAYASSDVGGSLGLEGFGNGVTVGAKSGMGMKLSDAWYWSHDVGTTSRKVQRISVLNAYRLTSLKMTFAFDVKAKMCFLVNPKFEVKNKEVDTYKSYFICKDGNYRMIEPWYYITNRNSKDTMTQREGNRLESRNWLQQMRGDYIWNTYVNSFADSGRHFVLTEDQAFATTTQSLKDDLHRLREVNFDLKEGDGIGVFPGVVYENSSSLIEFEEAIELE